MSMMKKSLNHTVDSLTDDVPTFLIDASHMVPELLKEQFFTACHTSPLKTLLVGIHYPHLKCPWKRN